MRIRRAEEADFASLADICVAAYQPLLAATGRYVDQLRDVATRAAGAELLVAEDDGRLLGTVTFVPDGGPLGEIARPDETRVPHARRRPRRAGPRGRVRAARPRRRRERGARQRRDRV